ncbi:MAG: YezD family protein [Planctomycetota bacterium]
MTESTSEGFESVIRQDLASPIQPSAGERPAPRGRVPEVVVDAIVEALRGVKYGQITVTVQDGLVVQIDRMERRRLKS